MGDLSNWRAALYKSTSKGNTPSYIYSITPTDSLPLRQPITLGLAGQLSLDLDLVVMKSTPPQYVALIESAGRHGRFHQSYVCMYIRRPYVWYDLESMCSGPFHRNCPQYIVVGMIGREYALELNQPLRGSIY